MGNFANLYWLPEELSSLWREQLYRTVNVDQTALGCCSWQCAQYQYKNKIQDNCLWPHLPLSFISTKPKPWSRNTIWKGLFTEVTQMDIQLLSHAVMYHTVDTNLIFRSPTTLRALFSPSRKSESLLWCVHASINGTATVGDLSLCNRCLYYRFARWIIHRALPPLKDALSYSLFRCLFHRVGRHLQLFSNNIEPSKGLIGLLLAVSGRGGKMGGWGGGVGGDGKDLWYRSRGEVRDCGIGAIELWDRERDGGGKWFVMMGKHQEKHTTTDTGHVQVLFLV